MRRLDLRFIWSVGCNCSVMFLGVYFTFLSKLIVLNMREVTTSGATTISTNEMSVFEINKLVGPSAPPMIPTTSPSSIISFGTLRMLYAIKHNASRFRVIAIFFISVDQFY